MKTEAGLLSMKACDKEQFTTICIAQGEIRISQLVLSVKVMLIQMGQEEKERESSGAVYLDPVPFHD